MTFYYEYPSLKFKWFQNFQVTVQMRKKVFRLSICNSFCDLVKFYIKLIDARIYPTPLRTRQDIV